VKGGRKKKRKKEPNDAPSSRQFSLLFFDHPLIDRDEKSQKNAPKKTAPRNAISKKEEKKKEKHRRRTISGG